MYDHTQTVISMNLSVNYCERGAQCLTRPRVVAVATTLTPLISHFQIAIVYDDITSPKIGKKKPFK